MGFIPIANVPVPIISVQQMLQHSAYASAPPATQSELRVSGSESLTAATSNDPLGDKSLRFFFIADNHSRPENYQTFIRIANAEDPDLIVEGGDFVHDATEPEIKQAYAMRSGFESPLYMVTGNHDADLHGPFTEPPPLIPPFQSFDQKGVHFILIDNETQTISDEQFRQLEADLEAHRGKPTFLAMHVPPKLSHEPLIVKLVKQLPLDINSPFMRDPEQVKRLHGLLKQYGVKAVLAGHTHFPDEVVEDGIRYITTSSSGGLNPKPGIQKEFLDIRVNDGQITVSRRPLAPANHAAGYVIEALDFFQDLNSFNHQNLGWDSYFPSGNANYSLGLRRVQTERDISITPTANLMIERVNTNGKGSIFGMLSLSAAFQNLDAQLGLGYKHSLLGDYNKGLFVSVAVTGNAGYLQGLGSAGVGLKAGVGGQYKNFLLEVGQDFSTNYSTQTLTAGYRF